MKKSIIILSFVLIILNISVFAVTNCVSIQDAYNKGMIKAYYSFNSDCSTDNSDNTHDLQNNTATQVATNRGNGCVFSGDDVGVSVTLPTVMNFSDYTCIMGWFNNTDTGNNGFQLWDFGIRGSETFYARERVDNGAADRIEMGGFYNAVVQENYLYTTYADAYGSRFHLVACNDGATGLIPYAYVNGAYVGQDIAGGGTIGAYNRFAVGAAAYDYSGKATAILDDIWVFNCNVSTELVTEVYNGGSYPSVSPVQSLVINSNLSTTINYNKSNFYISYNGTLTNYAGNFTCFLKNASDILIKSENVNLTVNQFFNLPLSNYGNYSLSVYCNAAIYNNASALELKKGTATAGSVSSLYAINDSSIYTVQEETGAGPINYTVNFTSVSNFQAVTVYARYAGNAAHRIDVKIWNYTSSIFQKIFQIDNSADYEYHTYNTLNSSDFTTVGIVKLSLEHVGNGVATHYFYNDYTTINVANISDDTEHYNLAWDLVLPTMTIGTSFTNNSNYYDDETISYNVTYYDANLFAVNHSIIKISDGTVKNNIFYSNLTAAQNTFVLNVSNSTTALGIGEYRIDVKSWDSHTSNAVKPIVTNIVNDQIIVNQDIKFYSDSNDIKYYNNQGVQVTYFYLAGDRYKFKVTFNTEGYYHDVIIETVKPLQYLSESSYFAHFVYDYRHWIDFQGKNVKNVKVTKLSDNKYSVQVEHFTVTDEVEFESIGDLNSVSASYFFNITAAPDMNTVLLTSIDESLNNIETDINEIYEAIFMIGFVLLWLGLWIFGYYAFNTNNEFLGILLIGFTIPLDIYFSILFFQAGPQTKLIGIAFDILAVVTLAIIPTLRRKVKKAL